MDLLKVVETEVRISQFKPAGMEIENGPWWGIIWLYIGSGNGLTPVRRQAITRTNVHLLLRTHFSDHLMAIIFIDEK